MLEFLRMVWVGTLKAMKLNPRAFAYVEAGNGSGWVVLAIAVLGGASLLLGQSVILFVNRVKPARFVLSLAMNGVIFTLSLIVWAVAIWLTSKVLFPNQIPLSTMVRLVALGAAPYVFGFLVLLPYAGPFIGRVLAVWSFLVVVAALSVLAGGRFWPALVCTAVGWIIITVMSATVGRPIVGARNALWRRITGSSNDGTIQDILTQFAADEQPAATARGGRS